MARQVSSALVTGGARGIGAAIAEGVIAGGGRVVVADVDDEAGLALVGRLGAAARFIHCDVTSESQVAAAVDLAAEAAPVDAVFANAGAVGTIGRIEEHALEDYRRTMDLLLTSVFLTVKHAVRVMRPHGAGAIVCTGSVASLRGGLGPHVYTAAKHAVKGLVESVAVDIVRDGLTINAIAPGGAVTSLAAGLMGDRDDLETPYRRLAEASASGVPTTAADVADAALFLAGASRINGACLVVDGGDSVLGNAGRASYYV
ncbi:SDR family oxidoreductase [Nocardioides daejeonensis]|uniref:SDR family oxidoreductase n=1 Tax=Nocardioides daejeonensis TaxID=1046556 RepID=UPI000D7503D3|nr:SDR family oxidoreductase [Nocardioides daejeonensis]